MCKSEESFASIFFRLLLWRRFARDFSVDGSAREVMLSSSLSSLMGWGNAEISLAAEEGIDDLNSEDIFTSIFFCLFLRRRFDRSFSVDGSAREVVLFFSLSSLMG